MQSVLLQQYNPLTSKYFVTSKFHWPLWEYKEACWCWVWGFAGCLPWEDLERVLALQWKWFSGIVLLMLNVDWFQPFEHFTYSVGVICLVLLNLPQAVRYKRENIILVGVIPGPSEPPLNINSYLSPLVSNLLQLWTGIHISTSQLIRAALLAVSCDLPAGRKVCGFLSHSANLGCSCCYCSSSQGFGCQNYSKFDRTSWELRTDNLFLPVENIVSRVAIAYDLLEDEEVLVTVPLIH